MCVGDLGPRTRRSDEGAVDCSSQAHVKLLQPIQFYPTSLPIIMMKLLFDCDMYCLMICAVSIMIPSIVAGSVVTLFGSAPGSDDVIILYTSALYITLILL